MSSEYWNVASDPKWQPDWRDAPSWAKYFAVNEKYMGKWLEHLPNNSENYLIVIEGASCDANTYGYKGNWRDSIRGRSIMNTY